MLDTHTAMAGVVAEKGWIGHLGIQDSQQAVRLASTKRLMSNTFNGPGGLIGVWAEENSRTSLFDATRRREVFCTGGRAFALASTAPLTIQATYALTRTSLQEQTRQASAMGSDLPDRAGALAPFFITYAEGDLGTDEFSGGLLQRI